MISIAVVGGDVSEDSGRAATDVVAGCVVALVVTGSSPSRVVAPSLLPEQPANSSRATIAVPPERRSKTAGGIDWNIVGSQRRCVAYSSGMDHRGMNQPGPFRLFASSGPTGSSSCSSCRAAYPSLGRLAHRPPWSSWATRQPSQMTTVVRQISVQRSDSIHDPRPSQLTIVSRHTLRGCGVHSGQRPIGRDLLMRVGVC